MPAQLLALSEGPNIVLDKPILLLGRHPECDIQIDSRKVSRRHCVIAQVADYLVVRDLDSTNGIRINGTRTVEGKLEAGDELTIGNHRYRLTWNDVPGAPPAQLMKKELAHPVAPDDVQDDDEVLESCEEPVPLAELKGNYPAARPAAGQPVRREPEPLADLELSPPQEPFILPEDIRLVPNSDVGPLPQGSGSHH